MYQALNMQDVVLSSIQSEVDVYAIELRESKGSRSRLYMHTVCTSVEQQHLFIMTFSVLLSSWHYLAIR